MHARKASTCKILSSCHNILTKSLTLVKKQHALHNKGMVKKGVKIGVILDAR
jgi:hypothetical protein